MVHALAVQKSAYRAIQILTRQYGRLLRTRSKSPRKRLPSILQTASRPKTKRSGIRWLPAAACLLLISGCYYTQALRGQLEVMGKSEPIAEVLADPDTPEALARRLELVADAREFSITELGLPDNGSYTTYTDLERDFVVWNVFATPEFSLRPKQWCYPIVGCVAYRGYFREAAAVSTAERLAEAGYDVHLGGVSAYSTLGRFEDPVLNTMMRWDDIQLVSVLFHELAHQVLYIKGDTAFNESFATAVEEIGVERYLESRGMEDAFASYEERKELRRRLMTLVDAARTDLETYYAETIDDDEKRLLKEHRLEALTADLRAELERSGRDADAFLARPFNNARMVPFALYEGRLPEFRQLLDNCNGDLGCFYDEVRRISELEPVERNRALDALGRIIR